MSIQSLTLVVVFVGSLGMISLPSAYAQNSEELVPEALVAKVDAELTAKTPSCVWTDGFRRTKDGKGHFGVQIGQDIVIDEKKYQSKKCETEMKAVQDSLQARKYTFDEKGIRLNGDLLDPTQTYSGNTDVVEAYLFVRRKFQLMSELVNEPYKAKLKKKGELRYMQEDHFLARKAVYEEVGLFNRPLNAAEGGNVARQLGYRLLQCESAKCFDSREGALADLWLGMSPHWGTSPDKCFIVKNYRFSKSNGIEYDIQEPCATVEGASTTDAGVQSGEQVK